MRYEKVFLAMIYIAIVLLTMMSAMADSGVVSTSVGVSNTVPVASNVAITADDSELNRTTANITGSYTYTDNNNDNDYSIFEWYNQSGLIGKNWLIKLAYYDSISISTQDSTPQDLFFKSDGTKLYEIGSADKVYQYSCGVAWNLSSCSYDSIYISTRDDSSTGLFFKPDGSKMYQIGQQFDEAHQYSCSHAWNLSSCTYDTNISITNYNSADLFFKSDGTKFYTVGTLYDKIFQYSCGVAWNLSSCSHDSNISTQDSTPQDLFFKSDGTKLYEIGSADKVYQYSCGVAWNLSSCSYDSIYISTRDDSSTGLFFKPDGSKMYQIGQQLDKIYEYLIGTTLSSSFTSRGDTVYLNVTPYDGIGNGTTVKSNVILILSTPPTTPSLTAITPSPAYKTSSLSSTCSGGSDADGDSITYFYRWNNGSTDLLSGIAEDTFACNSYAGCVKGVTMTVYCKSVTSDANSSEDSEARVITNSIPVATQSFPSVSIHHNENLVVQWNVTDADSDVLTYGVNESIIAINGSGYVSDNPSQSDQGVYSVKVNVTDGTYVLNNTWTYTVVNDAPVATQSFPSVSIHHNENLGVQWNITDTESDGLTYGVNESIIAINGSGYVSDNPSQSDQGVYSVKVNVTDGIKVLNNTWTYTVINDPPSAPSISSITPATAYTTSLLSVSASANGDNESDAETLYYEFNDTSDASVLQAWSTTATFNCNTSGCNKADVIVAHVKTYDGLEYSTSVSDTKSITDSNPTTPSINVITPATAYKTSVLNSTINVDCTDADSDSITRYWTYLDTDNATVLQNTTVSSLDCNATGGCTKDDTVNLRMYCTASGLNSGYSNTQTKSITNSVPIISSALDPGAITLNANSSTTININFTATDADGGADINVSSGFVNLTFSGESDVTTSVCGASITSNHASVVCNVTFFYFYKAGVWNISRQIFDIDDADPINDSGTVTINSLDSMSLNDSSVSWSGLVAGSSLNEGDSVSLFNLGNTDYSVVGVTGYEASSGSNIILAGNFSVDVSTGQSSGTDLLINGTVKNITSASLASGNGTTEVLYNYVDVELGLPAGTYTSVNDWSISLS